MKIVEPSVELWVSENETEHIAKCARVCYASDSTENNEQLLANLKANNHLSMFRHAGVYYVMPDTVKFSIKYNAFGFMQYKHIDNSIIISTNRQIADSYLSAYSKYEIPYSQAATDIRFIENKFIRYTFCVQTGIDITRELNRKSPNNIAEQSTRYVNFNKKVGIQYKQCHWMSSLNWYRKCLMKMMCRIDSWFYTWSLSKYGLNLKAEDARWCLYLDTMSKAVYTYSVSEWEYIINLRLFNWTGTAHPDAQVVAQKIYDILTNEQGYTINNYKESNNG